MNLTWLKNLLSQVFPWYGSFDSEWQVQVPFSLVFHSVLMKWWWMLLWFYWRTDDNWWVHFLLSSILFRWCDNSCGDGCVSKEQQLSGPFSRVLRVFYWTLTFLDAMLLLVYPLTLKKRYHKYWGHITRKPVFGVFDQVRLKLAYSATATSWGLKFWL